MYSNEQTEHEMIMVLLDGEQTGLKEALLFFLLIIATFSNSNILNLWCSHFPASKTLTDHLVLTIHHVSST